MFRKMFVSLFVLTLLILVGVPMDQAQAQISDVSGWSSNAPAYVQTAISDGTKLGNWGVAAVVVVTLVVIGLGLVGAVAGRARRRG